MLISFKIWRTTFCFFFCFFNLRSGGDEHLCSVTFSDRCQSPFWKFLNDRTDFKELSIMQHFPSSHQRREAVGWVGGRGWGGKRGAEFDGGHFSYFEPSGTSVAEALLWYRECELHGTKVSELFTPIIGLYVLLARLGPSVILVHNWCCSEVEKLE